MNKEDFRKQYLTKEWYETSKRIKARDKNTCQMCGRNDRPVSVHHLIYHKGHKVWEYEDKELICVCDRCHEYVSEASSEMYDNFKNLKQLFREFGFSDNVLSGALCHLSSLIENVMYDEELPQEDDKTFQFLVDVVRSTQDFNDLKAIKGLGVDESEFVKHLYPGLYKDYVSKK